LTDNLFSINFDIDSDDNERLSNLCGPLDKHLRLIERRLGIEINNRGFHFSVYGQPVFAEKGKLLIEELFDFTGEEILTPEHVDLVINSSNLDQQKTADTNEKDYPEVAIKTKRGMVRGRGKSQQEYLHKIVTHDINFGVGPAGTGKTYLAVACAVEALERDNIRRILLVRPAVEAGERLGFLPGDLSQKIDPYLRPLYDALYEMLGFERVNKLIERNVIEVAPLAYMRGRTLNDAFVILDEAQNTTPEQMKMFLTRIGFGSKAVVTGDVTQVDLPRGQKSGLRQAIEVLGHVDGISFTFFSAKDVVRHQLVQKIVHAYDDFDRKEKKQNRFDNPAKHDG
jgi:phosphate starvation-inducible PhoH-like protein